MNTPPAEQTGHVDDLVTNGAVQFDGLSLLSLETDALPHHRQGQCLFPNCTSIEEEHVTAQDVKRHIQTEHPLLLDSNNAYRCRVPGCGDNDKFWVRRENLWGHLRFVHRINTYDDLKRSIRQNVSETEDPSNVGPMSQRRIQAPNIEIEQVQRDVEKKVMMIDRGMQERARLSAMNEPMTVRSEELFERGKNSESNIDPGVHLAFQKLKRAKTRRTYQPVDVLLAARPDIPPGTTLDGLLHAGQSTTKKADVFLKHSERPDLALQEWAKALYIIEDLIPNHAEYGSLMYEYVPDAEVRLGRLSNWVTTAKPIYEEVKDIINDHNSGAFELEGLDDSQFSTSSSTITEPRISDSSVSHTFQYPITDSKDDEKARTTTSMSKQAHDSSSQKSSIQFSNSGSDLEFSREFPINFKILYPCHIRACPDYRTGFSSPDALMHHYELIHGETNYLCDYPTCQSQTASATSPAGNLRFLRSDFKGSKEEFRKHLIYEHKEDIDVLGKATGVDIDSRGEYAIEPQWWRCSSCLHRVTKKDGIMCKDCGNPLEPTRLMERRARFGSDGFSEDCVNEELTNFSNENTPQLTSSEGDKNHVPKNIKPERQDSDSVLGSIIGTMAHQSSPIKPSQAAWVDGVDITLYNHKIYTKEEVLPYEFIKQLGHGSLGVVDAVRVKGNRNSVIFARKTIQLRNVTRKKLLPLIQQEVAVLKSLNHHHIVKVLGSYETSGRPRYFGILLSPAGDEDLSHFLERVGENDSSEENLKLLSKWQLCLASAISYIHSQNIRHKDIKPSNMICKGKEIYLTDFGSAHRFNTGLTSSTDGPLVGITRMYSAPEVIANDRRGRPADVFSLGCVFAEMASVANGETVEEFEDYRAVPIEDEPETLTSVYHATVPRVLSWFTDLGDTWTVSLLGDVLAADHNRRPTADTLVRILTEHYGHQTCLCQQIFNVKAGPNIS
ncbi:hypothetical protein ACMFMG_011557 [Clarireedia jacksonii]